MNTTTAPIAVADLIDTSNVHSVAEVAEILGCTVKVAYHLIYSMDLDSVKIGRRLMVTDAALSEYIAFAA